MKLESYKNVYHSKRGILYKFKIYTSISIPHWIKSIIYGSIKKLRTTQREINSILYTLC